MCGGAVAERAFSLGSLGALASGSPPGAKPSQGGLCRGSFGTEEVPFLEDEVTGSPASFPPRRPQPFCQTGLRPEARPEAHPQDTLPPKRRSPHRAIADLGLSLWVP